MRLYDHNMQVVGQKVYKTKKEILHKVKDILSRYAIYGLPMYAMMKELHTGIKVGAYVKKNKVLFAKMGGQNGRTTDNKAVLSSVPA